MSRESEDQYYGKIVMTPNDGYELNETSNLLQIIGIA
jgi:hypothetical protein